MGRSIARKISPNNTTGVTGVSYQAAGVNKKGHKIFEEYKATLRLRRDGKRKNTSVTFSVLYYGEKAFDYACQVRYIYERYYIDENYKDMWKEIDQFVKDRRYQHYPH